MARLIYMQATIDLMHSKDPQMLNDLIKYGEPETKEIIRSKTSDSMADEAKLVFDFATQTFKELMEVKFND